MDENKVVTNKQIAEYFGVSVSSARKYADKARQYYNKEIYKSVTLGQVLKANNLEK